MDLTFRHLFHHRRRPDRPASRSSRSYPPERHVPSAYEQAALRGEHMAGMCTVCGTQVAFQPFTDNLRESGDCPQCGSSNRNRQMAWMLRRELALPLDGPLVVPPHVAIYNTEANGALNEALRSHPLYTCSEYWGGKAEFGSMVGGTRNEDLQALSFGDGTFDVVLSSDVFEHLPWPYRAHREVFRVLKPGGCHVFTVPYGEAMLCDDVRATMDHGKIVHHAEPLFHGDPVRPGEGILVWNIFGLQMLVRLGEIGFEVELWRLDEPARGIVGSGAEVFVAHKPHQEPGR